MGESSDIAIRVENLGKCYRIRHRRLPSSRPSQRLVEMAMRPFHYLWETWRGPSEEEIFWALKDISFEIKQGEVVGIIGPNGAGKSTLLKILSRITAPTTGYGEIRGRVASLLEVGTGFHPELTGRENIYLSGMILGMRRAEIDAHFDEIVDFAGIEQFLDTPVKRYSSGMYVRLGFAVAAHLRSEILLVDEILAVGDAEFRRRCLGKMEDVAHQGRTVLFVSHNMPMVQSLCKLSFLIHHGKIYTQGNTESVIAAYHRLTMRSSESSSCIDLVAKEGTPSSSSFLQSIWLEGEDGKETHMVEMGKPLYVYIRFKSHRELQHPAIGFCVERWDGERIFTTGTNMQGREAALPDRIRGGLIKFTMPQVPLTPGRYYGKSFGH